MGGRLIQPGSPQRVAIDMAPEYCRPANDEELVVMEDYAIHADHCSRCRHPKPSKGLCSRGSTYAKDVAQYIYQKMGLPFSVIDKARKNETVRVEIPVWSRRIDGKVYDMQPVKDLLAAAREGLNVAGGAPMRRQVVIDQPRPQTPQSRPAERRQDADYVEIRPAGRSEDRRERQQRPSTKPKYDNRGSLYKRDAQERQQREKENLEPVIVVAEPRRKYYR